MRSPSPCRPLAILLACFLIGLLGPATVYSQNQQTEKSPVTIATPATPTTLLPPPVTPFASPTPAVTTPVVPTPVPAPTPTATASPTPTPAAPTNQPGTVSGAEPPDGNFHLESTPGPIYDLGRGLAIANGDVLFTYRELSVHGDRGIIDFNTNTATLSGNLTVTARGQVFNGRSLSFNLDTGQWVLRQIDTVFPPAFFPPGTVLEPIYVKGGMVTGDYDTFAGKRFRFTSCDRDHYYLQSKRLDFYRDKNQQPDRIVLRHNALYVFKQKIIPLPVYVIGLQAERSRRIPLQPTFGQNAQDGYFVKSVYDLGANQRRTDSLLIDLLQKRGLGLGLQRELVAGAGLFYLYALSGKTGGREIDSQVKRLWQISHSLTSEFKFQSSKNNSLSGQNLSTQNGDLTFNFTRPRTKSTLLLRYENTDGGFGSSRSMSASLNNRHRFGNGLDFATDTLLSSNQFSDSPSTEALDNTLTLQRTGRTFDTQLRTELHNAITGLTTFRGAYQLERLPELTLITNTERLNRGLLTRYLPGDISLGIGDFREPVTQQQQSRADFTYNKRSTTRELLKHGKFKSEVVTSGRFQQDFYSDDTARYNYGVAASWNNTLGAFGTQVNYVKQKSVGFTPFLFDFLGPGESLDGTVSYQPSQKLRLNLSAGRDLHNHISRDMVTSLQLKPSPSVYASLGAAYSSSSRHLGDVIGNLHVGRNSKRLFGGTIDLGVRYSALTSQLTQINTAADLLVTHGTKFQALAGYNGFSKQFDFAQIRVVQDLHCFNLYTTYDNQRKELRFDLALKAFPFVDTRLGQGQFGQGFDPRIGGVQ